MASGFEQNGLRSRNPITYFQTFENFDAIVSRLADLNFVTS